MLPRLMQVLPLLIPTGQGSLRSSLRVPHPEAVKSLLSRKKILLKRKVTTIVYRPDISMAKHILLLGRKGIIVSDAQSALDDTFLTIYTGTCLEDVESAFSLATAEGYNIDHVFSGAGIDLENRLEIIRVIFTRSGDTTVHLKDATSGPTGFLPFVKAILEGLKIVDGREVNSSG